MRTVKQISYNRTKRDGVKIKYIVIHDTGNTNVGANAYSHYKYFNTGDRSSSADFFVDDMQILCVNDYLKYYTWHCGDGKGKYGITNSNSIGIEMCVNSDGDRKKVIEKTIILVKELMSELNIPINKVVRHYDASRKNCPASMNKNNWAEWYEFKKQLQNSEELTMTQYEELKTMINNLSKSLDKTADRVTKLENPIIFDYVDKNMPEYAKPTIQKLLDKGFLKGDTSGNLNLTNDMLRMLVVLDRSGTFDR